jgi:HSP20 family molecular chaperone IbpA
VKPVRLTRIEELLRRINNIHDEITRRAFQIFEGNGRMFGRELEDWFKAEEELLLPIRMDLIEAEEKLTLKAEVPGFTEKELEIAVEPRRVTITGKRDLTEEKKEGKLLWKERTAENLLREMFLPADIDTTKVKATLKNGILEIELPKLAVAKPVKVEAKAA